MHWIVQSCDSTCRSVHLYPLTELGEREEIVPGIRTGQNTSVKADKPMFKELFPKIVIESLLATVVWLIPWPSRPIRFIETEYVCLLLCGACSSSIRSVRRVEKCLVVGHANQTLGAASDFYSRRHQRISRQNVSRHRTP